MWKLQNYRVIVIGIGDPGPGTNLVGLFRNIDVFLIEIVSSIII